METAVRNRLTPMLGVHDAAGAIDFYVSVFGAEEIGERMPWEGKIGHAEIKIGDALIMLADEFEEHNSTPKRLGGTPVILHLQVEDTDATTDRAVASGADVIRAPENHPYGRIAKIRDPYGHIWMLNGPVSEE